MFLTKPQLIAYEVARNAGYDAYDAVPLCKTSKRFNTDVVTVRAIKEGENYRLLISSQLGKILSCELVAVQWGRDLRRDGITFGDGHQVYSVKKFSRPIK